MSSELREALIPSMCMNLRSFRKDGTPVDTPLWVIAVDDHFFGSYTDDRSFKYKRVRRNPEVEVAACDVWGRRSTAWFAARCRIVEDTPRRDQIFRLIEKKYGIHWKMSLWGSKLTNRVKHRVVLEFEVTSSEPLI
ncbi:MAG TPA: PPOX class F420-dependent oxidoreductase [Polyangiales bacterium]|jgi:PPOX class probable F420-dependent enzyme|nr:PPOX class F420-dependent oxidoreductase [Polyangiales bacterium]